MNYTPIIMYQFGELMMTMTTLTEFFGWASIINIIILLLSTIAVIAMRGMVTTIHSGMFGLEKKDLSRAYFQYLAQFKIAIIVLTVTPYFALKIIQ